MGKSELILDNKIEIFKQKLGSTHTTESRYFAQVNERESSKEKNAVLRFLPIISPRFIISQENSQRKMWDIFTLSLSVFNVWMIPFQMSFGPMIDMFYISLYLDGIIDVIFLFDTIVMFFTSYMTKDGKEIYDS